MQKRLNAPIVYGRLSEAKKTNTAWGNKRPLFSDWGELKATGTLVQFSSKTTYSNWGDIKSENLCLVEKGSGVIEFNGKHYQVGCGHVFKVFPGQKPLVCPNNSLSVLSIRIPGSAQKAEQAGEDLSSIKVVNPADVPAKVYEYETLGQEIITCDYNPGIGLLRFTFPIDRIPIHIHPFSARLIRVISGLGYTYLDPNRYKMDEDAYCLFPKGAIHTNGPVPGSVYTVYAVQLPWIDPKIDEEHIGGDQKFVRYVESEPPKILWKKKEELKRAVEKLGHET